MKSLRSISFRPPSLFLLLFRNVTFQRNLSGLGSFGPLADVRHRVRRTLRCFRWRHKKRHWWCHSRRCDDATSRILHPSSQVQRWKYQVRLSSFFMRIIITICILCKTISQTLNFNITKVAKIIMLHFSSSHEPCELICTLGHQFLHVWYTSYR